MSFLTRQEEVSSGGTSVLAKNEKVASKQLTHRASEKWPLRWVTLGVVFVCSAFWIAFFTLIF